MITFLLMLAIVGVIAGFVARAIVPGPDPMSVGTTMLLGIIGSVVGGFLGYVLFGTDFEDGAFQTAGLVGSIIGAVIALLVYRATADNRDRHVRV